MEEPCSLLTQKWTHQCEFCFSAERGGSLVHIETQIQARQVSSVLSAVVVGYRAALANSVPEMNESFSVETFSPVV